MELIRRVRFTQDHRGVGNFLEGVLWLEAVGRSFDRARDGSWTWDRRYIDQLLQLTYTTERGGLSFTRF